MRTLTILDLDNTLIYGTTNKNLSANILFRFSESLLIYERPNAKEFVQKCHQYGDVAVFTTAEKEYAKKVCENMNIKPIELFTREDCILKDNMYVKSVPSYYHEIYDLITIIDDLPDVWDQEEHKRCLLIQVSPFVGDIEDNELMGLVL